MRSEVIAAGDILTRAQDEDGGEEADLAVCQSDGVELGGDVEEAIKKLTHWHLSHDMSANTINRLCQHTVVENSICRCVTVNTT